MTHKWELTSRSQFLAVYRSGRAWRGELIWMRSLPNGLEQSRYGFSITKGIGKAVKRNRVRRLLREVMRLKSLKPGWDIVFVPRPNMVSANYRQVEESVDKILTKACLLEGNNGEGSNAAN